MTEYPQRLVHDALIHSARRVPDKVAIVSEGKPFTYRALFDAALAIAGFLRSRGIQRGDRVAMYMDNTFACVASIFGTLMAGGVILVVNPQTKGDKLSYILTDSGARFLFVDGHLAYVFVPALESVDGVLAVVCTGQLPTEGPRKDVPILPFDEVTQGAPIETKVATIPLDLAALIYTSGTTGHPKGVMLTHQAIEFATGSIIEYLRLSEEHRVLNVLPLAFGYGLTHLMIAMRLGATLVLERSFTYPAQVLNRIHEQEVTVFGGVPTIYALLLSMHAKSPLSFPSVTRLTNAAAALPADFIPKLQEIFPNALIFPMYGQTECLRIAYLEPELVGTKPSSVGRGIPGSELLLLGQDGKPVPPGEPGVLHVRGPHVMVGYWKLPDRTRESIKEGPFPGERMLCTNDWFKKDDEGLLYFVARSDDIIKIRGEKVSPVEVENTLHGIPGVREAAVIGIPDEILGQAIRAYVALEEGSTLTDKDIKKTCISRLEGYMVPKEVVFLKELPKTASGKIRKKGLEEIAPGIEVPKNIA